MHPGKRHKDTGPATSWEGCQDRDVSAHGPLQGHNHQGDWTGEVFPGLGSHHTRAHHLCPHPAMSQTHLARGIWLPLLP